VVADLVAGIEECIEGWKWMEEKEEEDKDWSKEGKAGKD